MSETTLTMAEVIRIRNAMQLAAESMEGHKGQAVQASNLRHALETLTNAAPWLQPMR